MKYYFAFLFTLLLVSCEPITEKTSKEKEPKPPITHTPSEVNESVNDTVVKHKKKKITVDYLATDSIPRVSISEYECHQYFFPCIDSEGETILTIYQKQSCCVDPPFILKVINAKTLKEISTLELVKQDGGTTPYSKKEIKRIQQQADSIIHSRRYMPMTSILNGVPRKTPPYNVFDFRFKVGNDSITKKGIHIPYLNHYGYCCTGLPEDTTKCKVTPNLFNSYYSRNQKLIFYEYGSSHGANGCDLGPFYGILKLTNPQF